VGFVVKRQRTLANAALWLVVVVTVDIAIHVSAAASQVPESSPADSIRCWWKSGTSAVYIGERFPVTLTCRIVDTAAVRVSVDESTLDSAAVQLSPFDVMDGTRYQDLLGDGHRFFQYRYSLRIIADDLFGREVNIPPLDIRYREQRAAGQGPAVEGPERSYRLPALPVRVTALASPQAVDIRDAPAETFGEIQGRRLRGSVAFAFAALLFSAALGCVVLAASGVRRGYPAPSRAIRLSENQILQSATRELERLRQDVDQTEWTQDGIGRALAAARLGMAIAMGQRPPQTLVEEDARSQDGTLIIRRGVVRPSWLMVSASVTPGTLTAEPASRGNRSAGGAGRRASVLFEDFRGPLNVFTAARYGRDGRTRAELDQAVNDVLVLLRRMHAERSWRNRAPKAIAHAIERRRRWFR
jgi:hypothetical protein